MLTFIIGATQSGKTTLAKSLGERDNVRVFSAGNLFRELSGIKEHTPEATKELTEYALGRLRKDPLISAKHLDICIGSLRNAIIEGCRNPTDILYLAKSGDHIIDLGGVGITDWEKNGLAAIRACRQHLNTLNITWCDYKRNFCVLPQPLAVAVEIKFLMGNNEPGTEMGKIISLECYEGKEVTACWKSDDKGGIFHDLPLEAFVTNSLGFDPDDASEYLKVHPVIRDRHCYSLSAIGNPVIELSPQLGEVAVFDRLKKKIGIGKAIWMMHWPEGNELMHLIDLGGRLLLWPPHKLLWNLEASELPEWKKLRQE